MRLTVVLGMSPEIIKMAPVVRVKDMRIEVDLREIKSLLSVLNKEIGMLIEDRVLAERSLLRISLKRSLMSILLRLGIVEFLNERFIGLSTFMLGWC